MKRVNVALRSILPLVFVLLAGCQALSASAPQQLPARPAYMLAGSNSGRGFSENALLLFDAATLTAQRTVELPASRARHLDTDPQGNLWVGLSGTMERSDERVLVFAPDGEQIHTYRPCRDPEGGIAFAAGMAFVVCAEDGFVGRVVVLDIATGETVGEIALTSPTGPFMVLASGATEDFVAVSGLTAGEDPNLSYAAVALIDAATLEVRDTVSLGPATDVWSVLPYGERFLLLNVASARAPATQMRQDALLLDPHAPDAPQSLTLPAAAPLWGIVAGDELIAYHSPGWNSIEPTAERALSRTHIPSGEGSVWPLPDGFQAGDVALVDGQICVAHWDYWSPDGTHGLYCLNEAGELEQSLAFADASQLLVPEP